MTLTLAIVMFAVLAKNRSSSYLPAGIEALPKTFDTAYPILAFQITAAQLTSLSSNPDLSKFTVTLDGTYAVTGTYSTYNLSQHATYNSATATGTGTLATSANPPSC